MTAVTPRPKSKMVELGEVIKHHREARGYDYRQASDIVGASISLFKEWEAGEVVPDSPRWGRLRNMLNRGLHAYHSLYTEALAEQRDQGRAKPLTAKPFGALANLTLVAPAPAPEPEPEIDTSKPLDLGHLPPLPVEPDPLPQNARPAGFTVGNLPAGWRLPANVQAREDFARDMIRANQEVTADEIRAAQTAQFGVATAAKRIREVIEDELAKISKAAKRQASKEARDADPYAYQRTQERKEAKASRSAAVAKAATPSVDETVAAAGEMLLEAIPNLASFTLTVDEQGQATVAYKTREVKVVETTGTITVGGKK